VLAEGGQFGDSKRFAQRLRRCAVVEPVALLAAVEFYNQGRAHSALGPGVPDPPPDLALVPKSESRHRLAARAIVLAKSVLGGLHHHYSLATAPAAA
jgi:hypothetical protein